MKGVNNKSLQKFIEFVQHEREVKGLKFFLFLINLVPSNNRQKSKICSNNASLLHRKIIAKSNVNVNLGFAP